MGTMKTRYLKTGRHNFSATLDIYGDGDHAVLTCWHRESTSGTINRRKTGKER
jgi:hypothetical protein